MVLLGGVLAFAQMSPTGSAKRIGSVTLSRDQQRAIQWTEGRLLHVKLLPIQIAKATSGRCT